MILDVVWTLDEVILIIVSVMMTSVFAIEVSVFGR